MTGEFIVDRHLGGYIAGGDPATLYPELWAWLVKVRGVRSVLDVGCGDGAAMYQFDQLGAQVIGVDGMPQPNPRIFLHDFTTGPWNVPIGVLRELATPWPPDIVWSCEFVEHVEERYIGGVLDALALAPTVLMTAAGPGQPGHHHVNCQEPSYWVGAMATRGYTLDQELTRDTRAIAGANTLPDNHYVRSGLAFTRRSPA